jgi:ribosomal protein S18 acetylase RimI-like enzyme
MMAAGIAAIVAGNDQRRGGNVAHDSSTLLMDMGRDVAEVFSQAPNAVMRFDENGWLGLTGEVGSPDFNFAVVTRHASASSVDSYIGEIRERGLDAILLVDQDAPDLEAAAERLGLPNVGAVPVMVWDDGPVPVPSSTFRVRLAGADDVSTTNALLADAFSFDEEVVQRLLPPSVVDGGLDIWIVEDDGEAIGTGAFIHRGGHVGVYNMATPEKSQRRGVGRAVLDTAMAHYLAAGATTFTLEATEAGLHLYDQAGFVTVATPSVFLTAPSTQFPG